jgi:hypothetical protein
MRAPLRASSMRGYCYILVLLANVSVPMRGVRAVATTPHIGAAGQARESKAATHQNGLVAPKRRACESNIAQIFMILNDPH